MITVYDLLGRPLRRSRNLRGVLTHYRAKPADMVVKVRAVADGDSYEVTYYWPDGDHAVTSWADWRVLLDWLTARKSWSIARVTFDAPLFDRLDEGGGCEANRERFAAFRKACAPLTQHTYKS